MLNELESMIKIVITMLEFLKAFSETFLTLLEKVVMILDFLAEELFLGMNR